MILWVRLHFGGHFKPWHLIRNPAVLRSPCGWDLNSPRAEFAKFPGLPPEGRVCKHCAELVIPDEDEKDGLVWP